MEQLNALHDRFNSLVWGWPMLGLLLGVGLLLTVLTRGVQFHRLAFGFRQVFGGAPASGEGTVTPFQALATSLASTVGVGNIAGVATAIYLGGPGALFWMLVSGVLGMATNFCEITIALRYRERDHTGIMRGGAMYVLAKGLGLPWLGNIFAVLLAAASFGIGNMVQANSVADAARSSFDIPTWMTGLALAALTAAVVLGGLRRIVEVSQYLVPVMCATYLLACVAILIRYADRIPAVVSLVVSSAFDGHAAIGGFAGAGAAAAIKFGVARGMFSNEAGMGSSALVHASAVSDHPVRQASYGMIGVFIDTLIVCCLTGFVVLATGAWQSGVNGAPMTSQAFSTGLPGEWGHLLVSVSLILFSFSTIIGWAFYGETGAGYLFGPSALLPYRIMWSAFVYVGAVVELQTVWKVSDTMNGLMVVPNLIGVLASLGLILRLQREFFQKNK